MGISQKRGQRDWSDATKLATELSSLPSGLQINAQVQNDHKEGS